MGTSIQPSRSRGYRRKHRRIALWSFVASLAIHVGIVMFFRSATVVPPSPFAAAGPDMDDDQAASGGGMQTVQLRVVTEMPPEATPVPVPAPVIEREPEPEPPVEIEEPQIGLEGSSGTLGEGQSDAGPGREQGTGAGDAGTDAEGRNRGVVPPSPRGVILPPSERPRSVRGKEVAVWVFVSDRGRVVSDSTRVMPSSGDRGFDRKLRQLAAEWVFTPARRAGSPVAEWFRYVIVL